MKLSKKAIAILLALCILMTAFPMTLATSAAESKVILEWDFENVSGNTVKDISGNGHNGTVDGATVANGVATFTGKENEYVRFPAGVFDGYGKEDIVTIEVEMSPVVTNNYTTFMHFGENDANFIALAIMGERNLRFATSASEKGNGVISVNTENRPLTLNAKNTVKYVIAPNKTTIYVNDTFASELYSSPVYFIGNVDSAGALGGKAFWNDPCFNGTISHVKISVEDRPANVTTAPTALKATTEDVIGYINFADRSQDINISSVASDVSVSNGIATFPGTKSENVNDVVNAVVFDNDKIWENLKDTLTVEMVIKPTTISQHRVFMSIGNENDSYAVMGTVDTNKLKFNEGNTFDNVIQPNEWVTVKYVISASGAYIYVNGDEYGQGNNISSLDTLKKGNEPIKFGQRTIAQWNDDSFVGQVSEIRLTTSDASDVMPVLPETDNDVLGYINFGNRNADVNVKAVGTGVEPTDVGTAIMNDSEIEFNSSILKEIKGELVVEMVIKPTKISDHRVLMSIGNAERNPYAVMGMRDGNALKFNETRTNDNVIGYNWRTVKYVIGETETKIYVDDELKGTSAGIVLTNSEGPIKFGAGTIWTGDAKFAGQVSEIRLSTLKDYTAATAPKLDATSDTILYYNDFSNEANGMMVMDNDDYIDLGLDTLKGNNNITMEFVIKPSMLLNNIAFAGIGDNNDNNWIVMGAMQDGALKYGERSNDEQIGDQVYTDRGLVANGVWSTVKYEITEKTVKIYVNGNEVKSYDVTSQKKLSEFTGDFVFGKELKWGDAAFTGAVSELRITTPAESVVENTGASMRIDGTYGIRFKGTVQTTDLPADATYGMLIIPETLLDSQELTKDVTDVLDIPAVNMYAIRDTETDFTGVITKIPEAAFDTVLVARAYVTYTVDGEEVTEYAPETDAESYRSVAQQIYDEKWGELSDDVAADLEAILGITE